MYLKISKNKVGKEFLSFVQGYRDELGKVKQKTIEKIGYLDDLKKNCTDPVSYYKNEAKKRSNSSIKDFLIKNVDSKIIDVYSRQKNLSYIFIKKTYNELGLDFLINEKQKKLNVGYNLNSILQLLVFSRILNPGSKNETYDNRDIFFESFDFSLHDLYRSLDYFNNYKDDICKMMWNKTKDIYKRDISTTYYDCTNYYFEISYNDTDRIDENGNVIDKGIRKKGPSKEKRKTPIIGMGLLMDKTGIPLSFDLFPGNESEKDKLLPQIKKTKRNFNIGRTIVVADRGLNTSDNTVFVAHKNNDDKTNHDGYIYGQSIVGSTKEFKSWAINQDDFIIDILNEDECDKTTTKIKNNIVFKHKSRIFAKTIQIKKNGKRTCKYDIYQKQLVYFSQKYADRQKRLRDETILKAKDLINNRGKYTKSTAYGANKYINNIAYDKKTGLIPDGLELSLKEDLIVEEEKYDGFYSIVTSELKMTDLDIRNSYKGLWKIEETFKITKSNLKTRPVYVWTKEHIESHFLTCFISLVIMRILEKKLNGKHCSAQILNSLRKHTCNKVEHDLYMLNYYDNIIQELANIYKLPFDKKYHFLSNIKNFLN